MATSGTPPSSITKTAAGKRTFVARDDNDEAKSVDKRPHLETNSVNDKGKWTAHVSLPVEFDETLRLDERIRSLVRLVRGDKLEPQQHDETSTTTAETAEKERERIDVKVCDEFHVSVSRLLTIKKSLFDPIRASICDRFRTKSMFHVTPGEIVVLRSSEPNKHFLAFELSDETSLAELKDVVSSVDQCLARFGLAVYYHNPTFHVSFAYFHTKTNTQFLRVKALVKSLTQSVDWNMQSERVAIKRVQMKCGNSFFFQHFILEKNKKDD